MNSSFERKRARWKINKRYIKCLMIDYYRIRTGFLIYSLVKFDYAVYSKFCSKSLITFKELSKSTQRLVYWQLDLLPICSLVKLDYAVYSKFYFKSLITFKEMSKSTQRLVYWQLDFLLRNLSRFQLVILGVKLLGNAGPKNLRCSE